MDDIVKGTAEKIFSLDDPLLSILLAVLFLVIIASNYTWYRFIKSLLAKLDTKEKEVLEAYTLIYKDSKANLELVFAFESKLDEHISNDNILKQDIHEILRTTESIKMRFETYINKSQ